MTRFQLLVNLASRIIHSGQLYLLKALREKQLGSAEANVLMFLYTYGEGIKQDDIVTGIAVSKPAISRTIMSLENKGYIVRKPNSLDKRSYLVYLTEKARREEKYIQKQFEELVKIAAIGIPDDKIEEFIEIFQKVAENLDNHRRSLFD
ncbi:MAG TPA: MarR family transcriptional regulator [Syntrophaceticus sp.]|nr:MarR family transcriptional regulator [Syntrophaceticus sp.]